MDTPVTAPPVVAVVVTCDAGPWFEETLAALGAQDYPNLSILVIDAASAEDPTPRVAQVVPGAFVRRLDVNPGYGGACNEVLQVVEGASHLLFCHDDAAPDPDAVRLLVEEAFRSNAGIVAPKLVDWEDPEVLLQVGMTVDKTGTSVPLVERGELDQEQHDGVRDVFVAPGGCTLVRADLFASLGGFDPAITFLGEDVDLSWRAQILGARVVVAPAARVRHVEALSRGLRKLPVEGTLAGLAARHAALAMIKAYGPWHLLRVFPQAVLAALLQGAVAVATGRPGFVRELIEGWRWNIGRRAVGRPARRAVQSSRVLGDAEVRRLQARGTAGVSLFARGRHPVGDDPQPLVEAASRNLARVRIGMGTTTAIAVAAIVLLGTRGLTGGRLASVGELAPFPDSPVTFLRLFLSGWRTSGLGVDAAAPPAFALLGLAGVVLGGAMGVLQKIVVLGLLPLGLVGVHRLARPLGSVRASAAALIVYAVIPVPYNALANGRWSGLVAYGALPWVMRRMAVTSGVEPFSAVAPPRFRDDVLAVGLMLALAAAIAPAVLPVVIVLALGLAAGGLLARVGLGGALALALAASVVAGVLLLPWSADFLLHAPPPVRDLSWDALLRFETGPLGAPPLGWAFVVAALLPLAVGRGWRLAWGSALWGGALAAWALAWVVARGWAPLPTPVPEVALAAAAACLALAVAMGVRAFELDLPDYHFGWRQLASGVAAVAVALGLFPVLGAALDGRWHQPQDDLASLVSVIGERAPRGGFRVLWLGEPEHLPLHAWRWKGDIAYATSRGGDIDATALWPGAPLGATPRIAEALRLADRDDTTHLGRLLAPMAVRYVVMPSRATPGDAPPPHASLTDLQATLARQVDLGRVSTDAALTVYENAAWVPARAALGEKAVPEGGLRAAAVARLEGATPALPNGTGPYRFSGPVADHSELLVAEGPSPRWELTVDGRSVPRRGAFGVANLYTITGEGEGVLRHRSSPLRLLIVLVFAVAWIAVAAVLVRRRWA